jgi:hypothetical protein
LGGTIAGGDPVFFDPPGPGNQFAVNIGTLRLGSQGGADTFQILATGVYLVSLTLNVDFTSTSVVQTVTLTKNGNPIFQTEMLLEATGLGNTVPSSTTYLVKLNAGDIVQFLVGTNTVVTGIAGGIGQTLTMMQIAP